MADEDTETREPDGTEQASEASAGQAHEPAPAGAENAAVAEAPKPDFDQLNQAISEKRKPAGPEFPEVPPDAALRELEESEEEDTDPTDPS